jgi:hypothetical protein
MPNLRDISNYDSEAGSASSTPRRSTRLKRFTETTNSTTRPHSIPHSSHRQGTSVATGSSAEGGRASTTWSPKNDETLIQARAQGLNWTQISPKHFPFKTANACRKRHERIMERQNAEQWQGVKLEVLAQAYMEARREMWSILAARVGEKWTLVEQKVFFLVRTLEHAVGANRTTSAWRKD